jgi:hypothetical protein
MDEILADYNEAELELLAGFLQKVTAAGDIAATLSDRGMLSHRGQHPPDKGIYLTRRRPIILLDGGTACFPAAVN